VHLICHSPKTVPQLEHDQIILGINVFGSVVGNSTCGDDFDLFQLGPIKAKEPRHLNNLSLTDEVRWIGAEFFNSRIEIATTHHLRQLQT
jgi:hypothetical protein